MSLVRSMVLQVDNVSRGFGATVACHGVSMEVTAGEVVALLGENGAGKSTLLSIIAGFVSPDSGAVRVDSRVLRPGEPVEALRAGVGTAFQHFSLAPALQVRESFELASLDPDEAARDLPPSLPLSRRIGDLTVPERQQVEFLKARMLARRVLLLDEPTSLLGDADVDRVLRDIQNAANDGAACVFVTHRLQEALQVADRIVVMRRGHVVERMARPSTGWSPGTRASLLAAMFGDSNAVTDDDESIGAPKTPDTAPARPQKRLVFSGVIGDEVLDISLEAGRVLAIAGIAGNGQQGLVDLLSGVTTSRIEMEGERDLVGPDLRRWVEQRVAVVPEDRFQEGGSVSMPIGETLVLRDLVAGRHSRWGVTRRGALRSRARDMMRDWSIRPADPSAPFGTLSGGNAQRVLLARALDPLPDVLVAVRPTHGLDHSSVAMVRSQIRAAAEAGTAVVMIEEGLDGALQHADRVAVVYQGRLSQPVEAKGADRRQLQSMMVGGWDA